MFINGNRIIFDSYIKLMEKNYLEYTNNKTNFEQINGLIFIIDKDTIKLKNENMKKTVTISYDTNVKNLKLIFVYGAFVASKIGTTPLFTAHNLVKTADSPSKKIKQMSQQIKIQQQEYVKHLVSSESEVDSDS